MIATRFGSAASVAGQADTRVKRRLRARPVEGRDLLAALDDADRGRGGRSDGGLW